MIVDIFNTNSKYDIIYSDPPWKQKKSNFRKCRPKQNKNLDYPTMELEDIKDLHKFVFDNLTEEKHNVFMWTIDKFLPETEKMMKELGYCLHAILICDKQNGIAPAFTVRFSHEYLLWFYKKGNILMPDINMRGKYTTIFSEKSTYHSKKPEFAYKMLENMFSNSTKLELFAREERNGWDCWGNEVN